MIKEQEEKNKKMIRQKPKGEANKSSGHEAKLDEIKKEKNISYTQELLRKSIHMCSLSIPIGYSFVDKQTALNLLIPLAILAIVLDIATKKIKPLREVYYKYFGKMLRKHEKKKKKLILNGASWVLISAVLTILIFPKILAVTGFAILIISDIAAALIGRKFGKTPLFTKSWEGTSSFIVSAFMVVLTIGYLVNAPLSYFIFGALGAIASGFAEAASNILKVDDNLSIPISFALVGLLGAWISSYFGQSFLNIM